MNPVFMIVGPPAVGKSTTSRALATCYPQSLHIPVDDLRDMVVSGRVLPSPEWGEALVQQLTLARKSAAQMAIRYHSAGFAVIIDDFWDANHASDYEALYQYAPIHKIALLPEQAEAHRRNQKRAGDTPARAYIDEGIQLVYRQLAPALPHLVQAGWSVVDTTRLSVDEAVAAIQALAAVEP